MFINFVLKNVSFHTHIETVLTEEIQTAKIYTEVFVMAKRFKTKLYIPESSLYMSPLRAIVLWK